MCVAFFFTVYLYSSYATRSRSVLSDAIPESYRLFDLYEGAQVKPGCKSMAYSLTLRHKDRTLETEEVDKTMKKILNGLEELNIELRS